MNRDKYLEDIYILHREYIEHEDDLVHQRTTTFITIQSFLLATFGFAYQKKYEISEKLVATGKSPVDLGLIYYEYNGFMIILALIGIATSLIALRSINAAVKALRTVEANWLKITNTNPPSYLPGITGGGNRDAHNGGVSLSNWAPLFFVILWIVVIVALIVVLVVRKQ